MRTLTFHPPCNVQYTGLVREHINTPEPCYYQRSCAVITRHGIVIVEDMDWEHNHGKSFFTVFTTVIKNVKHSATLDEGRLTDRQIKWMATNFIKKVLGLIPHKK